MKDPVKDIFEDMRKDYFLLYLSIESLFNTFISVGLKFVSLRSFKSRLPCKALVIGNKLAIVT